MCPFATFRAQSWGWSYNDLKLLLLVDSGRKGDSPDKTCFWREESSDSLATSCSTAALNHWQRERGRQRSGRLTVCRGGPQSVSFVIACVLHAVLLLLFRSLNTLAPFLSWPYISSDRMLGYISCCCPRKSRIVSSLVLKRSYTGMMIWAAVRPLEEDQEQQRYIHGQEKKKEGRKESWAPFTSPYNHKRSTCGLVLRAALFSHAAHIYLFVLIRALLGCCCSF